MSEKICFIWVTSKTMVWVKDKSDLNQERKHMRNLYLSHDVNHDCSHEDVWFESNVAVKKHGTTTLHDSSQV